MKQHAYCLTQERRLKPCAIHEAANVPHDHQLAYWIDVEQRTSEALTEFLHALNLHPLAMEACLDATPASRFAAYGDSLFVALAIHTAWNAPERTYLWIVCLPGLIVSIHEEAIPAIASVIAQYADGMRFHDRTTSAILYQVVDHIIDQDMAYTLRTRERIDELDERLDEGINSNLTKEALPLKRQLARLLATFEDQLYCVSSLQTIDSESFNIDGLRDYFRDAVSHLDHATRAAGRQMAHLNEIYQAHQLRLQDKTNQRLRLLTVISTIFLPLTLIAGIYGMNFRHMPELEWPYAYFTVLLLMLAIAVAMLWGFFRAGWFR